MSAFGSRVFWILILVVFGSTLALNGVTVHLSALLTDRGLSPGRAATVLSVLDKLGVTRVPRLSISNGWA